MNIMICYQELLDMLDYSSLSLELSNVLREIKKDKELMKQIEQYHSTKEEKIRKNVYQNQKYIHYKKLENRLNKLILQINLILGELKDENN